MVMTMRSMIAALAALIALSAALPAWADPGFPPPMYPDASNAVLPDARTYLGVAAYVPPAADFSPTRNLSNLIGKTSATLCIVGDSTSTQGPAAGNGIDPSQMVWGMLIDHLKDSNSQIATWNYDGNNFGIGGTNWNQLAFTGTQLIAAGFTLPAWFTDSTKSWLYYPQQKNCDVLFVMMGTNNPDSGSPQTSGGSSVTTFIKTVMNAVSAWGYLPNVTLVTNKDPNAAFFSDFGSPEAMSSFLRTFARSNANGYTSFANLQAMGFGLIDLGRYFDARVRSRDPASQYMQSNAAYVKSNNPIGFWNDGAAATTLAQTTDGDFRLEFTLPASGGTTLAGYGGGSALKLSASNYASNYLRFSIGGAGQLRPIYVQDGSLSSPTAILGTLVSTTNGADVHGIVSMRGGRMQVWLDADGSCTPDAVLTAYCKVMDIKASRQISGFPIQFGFATAPTGSPLINITNFYDGVATKTTGIQNDTQAYGAYAGAPTACNKLPPSGGTSATGCQGGNSANHQTSSSAALDRELIESLDFHVPLVGTSTTPGNVKSDGGATTAIAADGTITSVGGSPAGAAGGDLSGTYPNPSVAVKATPNYLAGNWYLPWGEWTQAGTGAAPASGTAVCTYGVVLQKLTIHQLGTGIATNVSAKHFQLAVYNNGSWGRPSTLVASTGDILTTNTGPASALVGVDAQVAPGGYWFCENNDTGAAVFRSLASGTIGPAGAMLGSATLGSIVAGSAMITGISVAQTYGTWPTFAGNTAWADVLASSTPIVALNPVSVP